MVPRAMIFSGLRLAGLSAILLFSCSRSKDLPPEVAAQYQKDAERFCNAIVQCMKDDISAKMAAEPERRGMILHRMTRDLCIKGQFQVIGASSVEITPKKAVYKPELYKAYAECADAVVAAKDCAARLKVHNENGSCKTIRRPLE